MKSKSELMSVRHIGKASTEKLLKIGVISRENLLNPNNKEVIMRTLQIDEIKYNEIVDSAKNRSNDGVDSKPRAARSSKQKNKTDPTTKTKPITETKSTSKKNQDSNPGGLAISEKNKIRRLESLEHIGKAKAKRMFTLGIDSFESIIHKSNRQAILKILDGNEVKYKELLRDVEKKLRELLKLPSTKWSDLERTAYENEELEGILRGSINRGSKNDENDENNEIDEVRTPPEVLKFPNRNKKIEIELDELIRAKN